MKKLCVVLVVLLCLSGCISKKENKEEEEIIEVKQTLQESKIHKDISHISEDKKETVYAKADAYGSVYKTEVEVILKAGNEETIEDVSDLKEIRNTSSDENFTLNGTDLVFENKGEDIHYKGLSEKRLPVNVRISYVLNGENIEADELVSKSGDLEIRFDYVNTTNINKDGFSLIEPFMAMSLIILDPEVFSDVKIENGKLIEYGDMKAALIVCAPSLSDTLRLNNYELTKDIDLKDYGIIKAKVKDFHLDYTATILSNGIFEELEEEDLNDLYDFVNDTKDFESNSKDLKEATGKLYDVSLELRDGLSQYLKAASSFPGYLLETSKAAEALKNGIDQLSKFPQLQEVLNRINSEKEKISEAINEKIDNDDSLDEQGKQEKKDIWNEYLNKLNEDYENAKIEESELSYLSDDELSLLKLYQADCLLKQTLKKLSEGAQGLKTGIDQLKSGADSLTANNETILDGLDRLVEGAKEFDESMNDFVNEDLNDLTKLGGSSLKTIADRLKALKKIDKEYGCFSGLKQGKTGKSTFIIETDAIGE